jgi:hypothetical protein
MVAVMVGGDNPGQVNPGQLAGLGPVPAEAILGNSVDLRGYPYKHLVVASHRGNTQAQIMTAVAAAEVLDRYGWELVNVGEFAPSRLVYAILRRRSP